MKLITNSKFSKVLATVLSLLMLLSMLPMSAFVGVLALENEVSPSINVIDEQGNPIDGASVALKVYITDQAEPSEETVQTGVDGVATFTLSYMPSKAEKFDYTVTAVNYETVAVTDATELPADVTLIELPTIDGVTVTGNTLAYTGAAQDLVTVTIDGQQSGDTVTYYIDGGEARDDSKATDAGTYEVKVVVSRDGHQNYVETKTVTIDTIDIPGITVTPATGLRYNEQDQQLIDFSFDGRLATDDVTITVNGDEVAEDAVVAKIPGAYVVKVTVTRDDNYNVFEQTETVVIDYGLDFDIGNLTVKGVAADYTGSPIDTLDVSGEDDSYKLFYSLDGADYVDTIPQVVNAGSYTLAVKAVKEYYVDKTDIDVEAAPGAVSPFNVYIAKIDVPTEDITIASLNKNYDGNKSAIVSVSSTNAQDTFKYSATGVEGSFGDMIEISEVTESGTYYVEVTRNDNYNPTVFSFDATINPIDVPRADIKITPYEGIYDLVAHPVADVTSVDVRDSFMFAATADGVFEDELTVKDVADSGTYFVKVIRNSANYNDTVFAIENVTIEKAVLNVYLEAIADATAVDTADDTRYEVVLNDNGTFQVGIAAFKGVYADGSEFDSDYAHVDETTFTRVEGGVAVAKNGTVATVTYEVVGDITVTVNVPESDNYKAAEKTFVTNVKYIDAPAIQMTAPVYTDGDNREWYDGTVQIYADGWQIIEDSNALGQTWSNTIDKSAEGVYDDIKVAFKNADGYITDVFAVDPFAIDLTNPAVTEFKVHEPTVAEKVLNILTFGAFANDRVTVTVTVKDDGTSSGVEKIELYANNALVNDDDIVYGENNLTATFDVPKDALAASSRLDVVLSAKVYDNVERMSDVTELTTGNSNLKSTDLMFETKAPVIENIVHNPYDASVVQSGNTSTIIYSGDSKVSFTAKDADAGLYSVTVKVNGNTYAEYPKYFHDGNAAVMEASLEVSTQGIIADENGAYKFDFIVVDCAGNAASDTITVYKDETAPIISEFRVTYEDETGDKKLANDSNPVVVRDYGYYFNKDVTVHITAKDIASANEAASGLSKIVYKAVDVDGGVVYEDVVNVIGAEATISFDIQKDFKGQIYAYAVDMVDNNSLADNKFYKNNPTDGTYDPATYNTELMTAGDYQGYVHPNGAIVETQDHHDEEPDHIVFEVPETAFTQNNNTALYAANVPVQITVKDLYAGIRHIEWSVKADQDTDNNYSGSLTVENDGETITYGANSAEDDWVIDESADDVNLATVITNTITVANNSNDIVVYVKITDRAGNTSEQSITFGIDKTKPTIKVEYGQDEIHDEEYAEFFRTDRVATITITERNFRAEDVVFAITNTDKVIPNVDLTKDATWTTVPNADPDLITHVATVKYAADGDYTFDISYKDNAQNAADAFAQHKFTIDKTVPTVSVAYDNNSAENGNYYKAQRIATITVVEHNFDASRVTITGTADTATFPALSAWTTAGDTHTATILYSEDALYSFDIDIKDKAGNVSADFTAQEFTVDKTMPTLAITGIVDQSANNTDGNIGFAMTASDTNFGSFLPVLTAIVMDEDGSFSTRTINAGSMGEMTGKSQTYTVTNLDTDGIYSITCTVVDKAGNAYSEVTLADANGRTYVEKRSGSDTLASFSVNRNGSVFDLDEFTKELVKTYYVQNVTNDVTIIEINADQIVENTVTLNGQTLTEDTDYTVSLDSSGGTWYKYSYVLNKSLFEGEGEYNIVVSSKDKATNEAYSDVKDLSVKFVVDRTAPIVTVTGLKTDGRYQVNKQVVSLVPSDDGGSLKRLIVRTVDRDGKVIKELLNLSGEALQEAIAAGKITFELNEGMYQNVQIICEDEAGNVIGSKTEEIYTNVTISTSAFMIFWANKSLRWGVIAGVVLLTAAIIFLIVAKKRKKAEDQK